jgi:hypothetical protein
MKKEESRFPITDELRARAMTELAKTAEHGKTRRERAEAKKLPAEMQDREQARRQPTVLDPEFRALVERVHRIRLARQASRTRKEEAAGEQ